MSHLKRSLELFVGNGTARPVCSINLFTFLPAEMLCEWLLNSVISPENDMLWSVPRCYVHRYIIDGFTCYHVSLEMKGFKKSWENVFNSSVIAPYLQQVTDVNGQTRFTGSVTRGEPPTWEERLRLQKAICEHEKKQDTQEACELLMKDLLRENPRFIAEPSFVRKIGEKFGLKGGFFAFFPDDGIRLKPFPVHCLNNEFRALLKDFLTGEMSVNEDVCALQIGYSQTRDNVVINLYNKATSFFSQEFTGHMGDDARPSWILKRCHELGVTRASQTTIYKLSATHALGIMKAFDRSVFRDRLPIQSPISLYTHDNTTQLIQEFDQLTM